MALDLKDLQEQLKAEGYEVVPIRKAAGRNELTRAAAAALKAIDTLAVDDRRKALALAIRMLKVR